MSHSNTTGHTFPNNDKIANFLKVSTPPTQTTIQLLKKYIYPVFLITGTFMSVHYAINPVGNARRMIVENRMNPVLLRVKHALPFVFLGLLYQYADEKFFYQSLQKRDQRNKIIEDFYKKNPSVLRE